MALTTTMRAEAIIRAKDQYTAFEGRLSNYGALKPFLDGANALLPEGAVTAIKNQSGVQSVVVPVLTKQTLTVITARSCTIVGTPGVSVKPALTTITRGFEILVYPKVNDANYISEEAEFANQFLNGVRSVLGPLDTFAAGLLESNKSTGLATTTLTGVAIVGNAYQINLANRLRLYYLLRTLMEKNDINAGVLMNVMNTEGLDLLLEYESHGTNNDVNMNAILQGDVPDAKSAMRHYRSNRITNGAGVSETHYVAPFGSVGVFVSNDNDAVNKRTGPNGAKTYTQFDPISGINWDVMEENICTDLSATYGTSFSRTFGTRYQFAADLTFLTAYSSDTTKPIVKVEVMTT
jgi:hypothetical protein